MNLALPVATAWLLLSSAPVETKAAEHPLIYDLTPLAEVAPKLQAAWDQRGAAKPPSPALQKATEVAQEDRAAAWRDPHTLLVARWLLADGFLRAGELDRALDHASALRKTGSGLVDPLVAPLASHLHQAKRPAEAADWGLAHVEAGQGMREDSVVAAERLRKLGATQEAITRVRALLRRTLTPRTRMKLTFLAADLEVDEGQSDHAIARLRRFWWETSSKEGKRDAAKRLKSLRARPGELEELAELAFETRAKDAKSVRRRLQRRRKRTKRVVGQRVIIWARALIAGLDKSKRVESEEVVAKYTRKLRGTDAEPWALVGHAVSLRRLDRDAEAAQVYEDMATRFVDHPLAAHALAEAAGLYQRKGLPLESDALYRRVIALEQHGEAEREALWQVGFAAHLRGEHELAIRSLQQLIVGYGGDRDGQGVTWTERAQYWWARAEAALGHEAEATRLHEDLQCRFPMGWYGLMSAKRLGKTASANAHEGSPKPGPLRPLHIVRRPALDYPVALMRLGADEAAMEVLKSLFLSGQLPGSGRVLLATLYRRHGEERKATSLLRRHAVLAERLTSAEVATYGEAYPYRHGKHLEASALAQGLSPSLMAGLVHVESRFNAKATSGAGAVGLAQLMPGTARRVSTRLYGKPVSRRKLRRPRTNLEIGSALMRRLLNRFLDHPVPALAAYNAGHGAATSWLRHRGHLPTDAWVETIPYDQTRRYVMRVVSISEVYRRLHGVPGAPIAVPLTLPATLGPFDDEEAPGPNGAKTSRPETTP